MHGCPWLVPSSYLPTTLVLLTAASLLAGCATAEELYTPVKTLCPANGGNFSAGSMFQVNRDGLLHSLSTAGSATNTGFLNTTFGKRNDQVFGVIMCFADTAWADCKKCLDRAPSYTSTACPSGRTGALLYRECLLRYSDEYFASIYTDQTEQPWYESVSVYVDDMVSMNNTRWKMMNRLIAQAAAAPLRYALDNNESYKDPTTGIGVHGLVQCRRDLTPSWCTICLHALVLDLLEEWPNNTAASLRSFSCYVKYDQEPITLMTVPEPPPDEEAPPPPDPPSTKNPKAKMSLMVAAAASAILLLTLAILLRLFFGCMLKGRTATANAADEDMEGKFRNGAGPKGFSYGVLAAATSNFSDDQKLGEGGFGSVYKGFLDQLNLHVAIKRVSRSSSQGRKEYASEVTIISQLRHRNLVKLIGWCHSHDELLLVYDLMPNGSLDRHLYSADNILSWQRRYDIILGIGSALLYLHQDCEQGVLHRDIKPSNVMLDASFNAKLGDFGLARLVDHGRGVHTTELAGTMGYMDPDCMVTGRFSTESDMYAFGVVLLEVACGQRPIVVMQDENENTVVHLARRVLEMHGRGEALDAADPRLDGNFDARQMERVLVVGLWCTAHDRSLRPSIWQAVRALRFESSEPTVTNGRHEPLPVIGRLASLRHNQNLQL
ncbi:L-type lectin-domain containing receptor kinase IX.1-like [Miscanthus floridulus]|uniref:L-type lectin-domain containing receptor kinase IX.1-like n=1 Tax=Miscanthus floridulus TaxID=154761 RepID=UPI003459E0B6